MRDVIIGRFPTGRLVIFVREREAWKAKRANPKLRIYRYAYVGEAAPFTSPATPEKKA